MEGEGGKILILGQSEIIEYRVFFEFCLVRKANKNINLNRLFMDDTEFERGEKRLFNENSFNFFPKYEHFERK